MRVAACHAVLIRALPRAQTSAFLGWMLLFATARAAPSPQDPAPSPDLSMVRSRITHYAKENGLMPAVWWQGQLDEDPAPEYVALLCRAGEEEERGEFLIIDHGEPRFVATVEWRGGGSKCLEEPRFGSMPQPLSLFTGDDARRLSLTLRLGSREGGQVQLGIRGGRLAIVGEEVTSYAVFHQGQPGQEGWFVTEMEFNWDQGRGRAEFAKELRGEEKDVFQAPLVAQEEHGAVLGLCRLAGPPAATRLSGSSRRQGAAPGPGC